MNEVFAQDMPKHWQFHVDTADGFQGDERDIILFSLVGGSELPHGSKWFLAHSPNRFNVAVSRARILLHVFGDEEWASSCEIDFIERLCLAAKSRQDANRPRDSRSELIGPIWEDKLAETLDQAGIRYERQYPSCGRFLDFAIFGNELKLDVEVDGEAYHRDWTGSRRVEDLQRDVTLVANGWYVLRFWVYQIREDADGCVDRIERLLRQSSSAREQ